MRPPASTPSHTRAAHAHRDRWQPTRVPLAARPRPKASGRSSCLKLHFCPDAQLRYSVPYTESLTTLRQPCASPLSTPPAPLRCRPAACRTASRRPQRLHARCLRALATLTVPAPRLQALRERPLHSLGALRDRVPPQRARHLQLHRGLNLRAASMLLRSPIWSGSGFQGFPWASHLQRQRQGLPLYKASARHPQVCADRARTSVALPKACILVSDRVCRTPALAPGLRTSREVSVAWPVLVVMRAASATRRSNMSAVKDSARPWSAC